MRHDGAECDSSSYTEYHAARLSAVAAAELAVASDSAASDQYSQRAAWQHGEGREVTREPPSRVVSLSGDETNALI